MPGHPLKRARREAIAALESGEIPQVRKRSGLARTADAEWVESAWQAYLEDPSIVGLSRRMGITTTISLRLVEKGGRGSIPFAARLHAVNQARAEASRTSDVARLEQNLALLGKTTDADTDLMAVVVESGKAMREKLADEPSALVRAKTMAQVVDPDLTSKVTKSAALRAETFQAVVERRPIGQGEDPAQAVATIFRGLLGGLREAAAEKLAPKAIEVEQSESQPTDQPKETP